MENSAKKMNVSHLVKTKEVPITESTVAWIETLYQAGAVTMLPSGGVELDPCVRDGIRALHAVLSGGEVEIKVKSTGGNIYEQLETLFDKAVSDADVATQFSNETPIVPYVP